MTTTLIHERGTARISSTIPHATTWQTTPPPKDRQIVINGNISCDFGDGCHESFPICDTVKWNENIGDWVGRDDLTLTVCVDDTLHIHAWIDLPA